MSLFRGIVYCTECGKKHKYKKRAKKAVYVCSTYDNYGKTKCNRNQVSEDEILFLITGHFSTTGISQSFISDNVLEIIASDNKLEIYYRDGEKSLLSGTEMIR